MSPEYTQRTIDIGAWVNRVRNDPYRYRERQATEILLVAIGTCAPYGDKLFLKGGVLMGIAYCSPRQTVDIDYTSRCSVDSMDLEDFKKKLDQSLLRAAAQLGYPDMVCCVQSVEKKPRKDHFEDAKFPALQMKLAYALRDSREYEYLLQRQCPHVLKLEISFNEPVDAIELISLKNNKTLYAYSMVELIAEKLRALLQQVVRKRNRRQDIYDIDFLLREYPLLPEEVDTIYKRFIDKSFCRELSPNADSLSNPEVRERAQKEWDTLGLEVEELPDFDEAYSRVEAFYRSLPWR